IAPRMFQCHGAKAPCSSAYCKVPWRTAYAGRASAEQGEKDDRYIFGEIVRLTENGANLLSSMSRDLLVNCSLFRIRCRRSAIRCAGMQQHRSSAGLPIGGD
ncbi:hypothetical protein NKH52_34945, partial [Mesorhizobium sp. M1066]